MDPHDYCADKAADPKDDRPEEQVKRRVVELVPRGDASARSLVSRHTCIVAHASGSVRERRFCSLAIVTALLSTGFHGGHVLSVGRRITDDVIESLDAGV